MAKKLEELAKSLDTKTKEAKAKLAKDKDPKSKEDKAKDEKPAPKDEKSDEVDTSDETEKDITPGKNTQSIKESEKSVDESKEDKSKEDEEDTDKNVQSGKNTQSINESDSTLNKDVDDDEEVEESTDKTKAKKSEDDPKEDEAEKSVADAPKGNLPTNPAKDEDIVTLAGKEDKDTQSSANKVSADDDVSESVASKSVEDMLVTIAEAQNTIFDVLNGLPDSIACAMAKSAETDKNVQSGKNTQSINESDSSVNKDVDDEEIEESTDKTDKTDKNIQVGKNTQSINESDSTANKDVEKDEDSDGDVVEDGKDDQKATAEKSINAEPTEFLNKSEVTGEEAPKGKGAVVIEKSVDEPTIKEELNKSVATPTQSPKELASTLMANLDEVRKSVDPTDNYARGVFEKTYRAVRTAERSNDINDLNKAIDAYVDAGYSE